MVVTKSLALLFSLLILFNGYLVRRAVGTWLFPAALFALFWFAITCAPLLFLFHESVSPWAVAYLFLLTSAFSLGAFFTSRWRDALRTNALKPPAATYFNTRFLRLVFHAAWIFSLLFFVLNMRVQGFALGDLFLRSLQTAALYAARRNTNTLEFSLAAKLGMVLAYLAAVTGGLLFGSARSRGQAAVALLGAFLPAIAVLLLESAKGLFFQFIALFLGCLVVTRLFESRLNLLDRAGLRSALLAVVFVASLTTISFIPRGLGQEGDRSIVVERLQAYFASYAFGQLYAFSDWYSYQIDMPSVQEYDPDPAGYGFYTFTPLFRVLGSTREVPPGTYDEYFRSGDLIGTNIYTMFRGLIIDFGMLGALLYMFVSGVVIHLAFYFLLVNRHPVVSVAVFIYVIGYFYSSMAVSLLSYNSILFNAATLAGVLWMNRWRIPMRARPA